MHNPLKTLPAALAPLKNLDRWLIWKRRPNAKNPDKPRKVPFQAAHPERHASTTDESSWGTYQQAAAVAPADGGTGWVMGKGIAAFDLDDCRNKDTGELDDWAQELVDEADSYTEVTPSGKGVRIIGRANGPPVHEAHKMPTGKLEIYRGECGRYITVSGKQLNGYDTLRDIDELVDARAKANGAGGTTRKEDTVTLPKVLPDVDVSSLSNKVRTKLRDCEANADKSGRLLTVARAMVADGHDNATIAAVLMTEDEAVSEHLYETLTSDRERNRAVRRAIATARKASETAPSSNVLSFFQIDGRPVPPVEWLIKKMILMVGVGVLVGRWGKGKTYLALEIARCIGTGKPCAGRKTKRAAILYIAVDRPNQAERRANFMVNYFKDKNVPLFVSKECPSLREESTAQVLINTVNEINKKSDVPVGLIIVDTWVVAARWKDEQSSSEVQPVVRLLREVSAKTGTFILVVDHTGLQGLNPRGSSDKQASTDILLTVKEDGVLELTRNTDGPEGQLIPFELQKHVIGEDEDGDPITECTVTWGTDIPRDHDRDEVLGAMWALNGFSKSLTIIARSADFPEGDAGKGRAKRAIDKMPELIKKRPNNEGYELTEAGRQRAKMLANGHDAQ